ncbi:hypothetical protein ZYGR_0AD03470 [Zygosaccharomyces rouxii]|uniref:Ubiquitin domain-containing protein DSK2 n=1 Tax=Zygosaccharomyces rouxii TaxID=4956 RepID=A0A1Q3A605_ZYGRO|nr:hypothetical protein ZYGR_0AD03470 [Zygosaccharomyces rouxii]
MSTITVQIKSGQNKWEVTVDPESTVSTFKEEISKVSEIPASSQRLIYSGKILKDDQTLQFYNLQDGHSVHLVKSSKAPGNASGGSSSTAAATAGSGASAVPPSGNASTTPTTGAPSNLSAGQSGGFNPLANLTSARYAGFTSLPSADMFGPDGGATNMPNQEDLLNMLDNPIFQSQMNEMLSNPQMVDFMIQSNPQLQAMGPQARQMFQSPFFRQMLTNPQMIRQSMQFARMMNPGGGENDAANAFPAPGNENTEGESAAGANDGGNPAAAATNAGAPPAGNPFAALLGGGGPLQQPGGLDPQLLASMLGAPSQQQQPQDNRPPEERYETQLRQLNEMGFFDFDRNVAALRRSGGSVQGALDSLLNGDV